MTVTALIRKLEKIAAKHGPRTRVTIDLRELKSVIHTHDEYSHWEMNCVSDERLPWAVDDSFELADGTERMRTVAVLS